MARLVAWSGKRGDWRQYIMLMWFCIFSRAPRGCPLMPQSSFAASTYSLISRPGLVSQRLSLDVAFAPLARR
ncbi:uncharacterized protein BDZ83DRAFT_416327 [Colletotrichum acutatum]|uniref:Uncharacterized protein n=1 Tax=Glomerella acutata TaxID=27357 RepID=A0AAD8UJ98_GLOAC|nr:uncharacterized protein BDZ83DRAFT_416327 [Colletotrichum acutatum]KAK1722558.1 hypothetical protein BDZ83DRAFT_416327 [Colletotrichum acutatum]